MRQGNQDLCFLSIADAAQLVRTRKISPVELTQAFLARIEAVDNRVKSYVTLMTASAMEKAQSAESEILQGNYRGPLHGIPIALKDLYDTEGIRTTGQSKVLENRVPTKDATTTRLLKEAGAIILGKLAMHEFALGGPQTSLFEQACNPWNLEHVTGGSSSGSGAAVAAALCMGALGSDTAGSIRGPASLCGIVGLKPTYGRVSRYGVLPLSWSLDHCGPMTWTVEDTAIILQAIAGYDPLDPTSSKTPVPNYSSSLVQDVKGLTIGVPRHYFFNQQYVDSETLSAVDTAISDLQDLGAKVQEITVPSLEYTSTANTVMMIGEAFGYHRKNLITQPENFGEPVRLRFYSGSLFSSTDYIQAQRARSRAKREFAAVLDQVDVIVCPTSLNVASRLSELDPLGTLRAPSFTAPFNQTGMPAISIPCGFNKTGLPIGLQIAGRPFSESTVIQVAYTYQQYSKWFEKRPVI
ncbi:Asp-tRNA(Asn)/Glu-tRNA(Gln) amidotransferase subunit GatA [SAR202 cluster bacterium AD-802-E10_MRT_200m]|nr:Asp-tRNA(Asn)/Glu-tRNA(Gln) amidotransferase subunit GatA [SAR202 cluster bacterium AD-802-E10_MRT_200m]